MERALRIRLRRFRMGDLIDGMLHQRNLDIQFTLYATSAGKGQELYVSPKNYDPDFTPLHEKLTRLDVFGQPWFLKVASDTAFEESHESHTAFVIFCFGIVVSCLLGAMFFVLANQRQRALLLASSMTEDARAKNMELKNHHERFTLALESSAMGIWSLHFADNSLQWDAYMYVLFGTNTDHKLLTYDRFFMWVHNDDRQRVFEEIAQAIEGKTGYDTEYRMSGQITVFIM